MRRGWSALQRFRSRLACQSGFALPFALVTLLVLGGLGTSVVSYTSWNTGSAARSNADQVALALAEAGLNYAYATLYNSATPANPATVPSTTVALDGGTATYAGTLVGDTWTLTGTGTVRNPTGPAAAPVVRSVSGRVRLGSALRSSANNAVWNYVYADALTGCTSLANSVVLDVPLYVRGNLCLTNSAQMTGYALRVGGNVTVANLATVGTAAAPIYEVSVGGTCQLGNNTPHSPCGPADQVHAQVVGTNPPGLTKPPIDLARWYSDSQPGPKHACTSGSFPGGFDNDGVMNRSLPPVNLTPATAYDCRVLDAAGYEVGRLSWTPGTPGSLKIAGTIFFDGDISFSQYNEAVYEGRATIYSSGKITFANQTRVCGEVGCPDGWDPDKNLLAFVAGSSTDSVGFEIGNNSRFQGAAYAVTDFREGNNTIFWGPVIANQVYLINSTIHEYVPIGTLLPGMPATYEEMITLVNVAGSWG